MKERPILFSAPMVRAILDGTKTQTRRVVKPRLNESGAFLHAGNVELAHKSIVEWREQSRHWFGLAGYTTLAHSACPYGQPGDRLWVRETFYHHGTCACYQADGWTGAPDVGYQVTPAPKWKPSIHMPRWASRILLEITGVRVERLQEISVQDAIAEGCASGERDPVVDYLRLWESLNGPGSWAANPWVWVVEFSRVTHA